MRRGIGWMDAVTALTIVGLLSGLALVMRGGRLAGAPLVIDGDTLVLAGQRLRLQGLDAPEIQQICERRGVRYRCGEEAKLALRALIAGQSVTCVTGRRDRFDRLLATCAVDGRDLGGDLVRRGLAVAYGGYEAEEREAKAARLGLWEGRFERPADWRRRHAASGPRTGRGTEALAVAGEAAPEIPSCLRGPGLPMKIDGSVTLDDCREDGPR